MRIIFKYNYKCHLSIITPDCENDNLITYLKDKLDVKNLPDPVIVEGWIFGIFFMGQIRNRQVYLSDAWKGNGREIEVRDVHADKLGVKLITELNNN